MVKVRTFFDVDRVDPVSGTITSIEGDAVECDLAIVIPPFMGAPVTYVPDGTLDENRFVRTGPRTLRVQGTETAFAIGDATSLPTSKSGVGAHLEAKVVADALAGRPATFGGRTHCPLDLGGGRATFVASTYDAPTVPSPPNRRKHAMKLAFARLYWLSLRGALDPVFTVYFKLTEPPPRPGRTKG